MHDTHTYKNDFCLVRDGYTRSVWYVILRVWFCVYCFPYHILRSIDDEMTIMMLWGVVLNIIRALDFESSDLPFEISKKWGMHVVRSALKSRNLALESFFISKDSYAKFWSFRKWSWTHCCRPNSSEFSIFRKDRMCADYSTSLTDKQTTFVLLCCAQQVVLSEIRSTTTAVTFNFVCLRCGLCSAAAGGYVV